MKTSDEGDDAQQLSRFVHQALVRRQVVVDLITEMKQCGHPAYAHVNLEEMEAKARETLPEKDVPAEIAKLIPYDTLLDNIQVQKQATPTPGRCTLEEVAASFRDCRPNAVVLEKSSVDEADLNAQRIAAITNIARQTGAEQGTSESDEDTTNTLPIGVGRQSAVQVGASRKITVDAGMRRAKKREATVTEADVIAREHRKSRKVERLVASTTNTLVD